MKKLNFLPLLLVFPTIVFGASRSDSDAARVGMNRISQSGARMLSIATSVKTSAVGTAQVDTQPVENNNNLVDIKQ